jgi:hypothetical protein
MSTQFQVEVPRQFPPDRQLRMPNSDPHTMFHGFFPARVFFLEYLVHVHFRVLLNVH